MPSPKHPENSRFSQVTWLFMSLVVAAAISFLGWAAEDFADLGRFMVVALLTPCLLCVLFVIRLESKEKKEPGGVS